MELVIREVAESDWAAWHTLWDGYNRFYGSDISAEITQHTWQRLRDPHSAVHCRVAVADDCVVGFAMIVLHEGTWVTSPICYLEDLFVAAEMRGQGIARRLIQALIAEGKSAGWSRLYWHTAQNNPARNLYDEFTPADEYVRYRMNL